MIHPSAPVPTDDLESLAAILEATGNYRIHRRMRPLSFGTPPFQSTKRAVFVDVETTGLDSAKDSVIELGVLPFDYTIDGTIVGVGEPFGSLQDPGFPIPAEITVLTGIDDGMVRGSRIDPDRVAVMIDRAALVISHSAGFDRPFCEREWPIFAAKPWGCSLQEIDWAAEGFQGRKLSQIAAGYGFFFDAHRAVDDCRAGVDILARQLPRSGRSGLATLLASARAPRWRLWADGAPYAARGALKARKYRWSSGECGGRRAWYRDVEESGLQGELDYLRSEIFGQSDVDLPHRRIDALERYSPRECTGP